MQDQVQDSSSRDERLERLEALVAQQQQTIAELQAKDRGGEPEASDARVSRRRLLAGAGAAAAGAVAGSLAAAAPAGATFVSTGTQTGEALQIGGANTNSSGTTTMLSGSTTTVSNPLFLITTTGAGDGIKSENASSNGAASSVYGRFSGATIGGVGVKAERFSSGNPGDSGGAALSAVTNSSEAVGVSASSSQGPSIELLDDNVVMPPTTRNWRNGALVNSFGQLWYCYAAGNGPASKWVRLSSAFVPLPSPVRIYYSLTAGDPVLASGQQRDVPVTNGTTIPHTASAVLTNLAVTPAGTGGFLAMFKDGVWPGTSNLNFAAGEFASNNATSAVVPGSPSTVRVYCGGASVHFVVDVCGYYL